MDLSRNELRRLHECLTCSFFERCEIEVANPEDYPDDQCKTKDMFNEQLVNETCKMYENADKKILEDWLNN